MRLDECSEQELRESQTTKIELTSQIKELQDRVNSMNDSRKYQAVESMCSGGLSHVPSQLAVVPSLRGMLIRNRSLRPDIRNSLATSGNVFDNPCSPVNSVSTSHRVKHPWNLDATFGNPVQSSTGRLVARSEEQNRDTFPTPRFSRSSARNSLFPKEGGYSQNFMVDQQKKPRSRNSILMILPHLQHSHVGR